MKYTIAIQPDDYGNGDAFSPLWQRFLEDSGHQVRIVNVYRADIMNQVAGCQGFMWRHGQFSNMRQIAHRLLPVLEKEMSIVVYPDQNTCWHYDDKISQKYLLEAAGIPIPKTWVWYDAKLALEWAQTAVYPLVIKLWSGAGSNNVGLVSSFDEAELWINKLFGRGIYSMEDAYPVNMPLNKKRIAASMRLLLKGKLPSLKPPEESWDLHKNYVLFQEFLPNNAFDHRIVIIGNRAFGFRRYNRPNDFRASGSSKKDINPENVDIGAVRLGFRVAEKLKTQSIAIDCLLRGKEHVVGEISYTYPHWTVHQCPGHWKLKKESKSQEFEWNSGQMWPEEAQVIDFIGRLNSTK
jgi:glutathione synthase/RimK-type ligase-like ATP-grasp enzyme